MSALVHAVYLIDPTREDTLMQHTHYSGDADFDEIGTPIRQKYHLDPIPSSTLSFYTDL